MGEDSYCSLAGNGSYGTKGGLVIIIPEQSFNFKGGAFRAGGSTRKNEGTYVDSGNQRKHAELVAEQDKCGKARGRLSGGETENDVVQETSSFKSAAGEESCEDNKGGMHKPQKKIIFTRSGDIPRLGDECACKTLRFSKQEGGTCGGGALAILEHQMWLAAGKPG